MNVVMFAPEDLNLVKGSPQIRRRFIDMEIGQVSPVYMSRARTISKVLQQRNQYLKLLQSKNRRTKRFLMCLRNSLWSSLQKSL